MSYATCRECGDTFWRDEGEEWKRVCIDCWKEKKRIEASRESELQQEIEQLRSNLATARREADAARPLLDRKFIKRIVALTHPDKLGNSKVATEITQQLLAIMQRQDNLNPW